MRTQYLVTIYHNNMAEDELTAKVREAFSSWDIVIAIRMVAEDNCVMPQSKLESNSDKEVR
jgi:hypothetical protein